MSGAASDDADAWASAFAEDGSFESPMGSASGVDDLRAWIEGYLPNTRGKRHASACHVVAGDGETARHTGYLTVYETAEAPRIVATGEYTDELVKIDGRWVFTHRRLDVDPSFSFEGA